MNTVRFDVLDADAPRLPEAYVADFTLSDLSGVNGTAGAVSVQARPVDVIMTEVTFDALAEYARSATALSMHG